MTGKTPLTLADLDEIDAAVKALEDPGDNLGCLKENLFPGWALGWPKYLARAANHAPAMTAAIRALLRVYDALLPFEEFLKAGASAGGKHATLLAALREFRAGQFAGLLETVSGEGGEDAKTQGQAPQEDGSDIVRSSGKLALDSQGS